MLVLIFFMPSRVEPCGLNQMYSSAYGTIPIVREREGYAIPLLILEMMEMEFVTIKQRLATFVILFKERYVYRGQTTIKQNYKTRYERRPFLGQVCQEYIEMYHY
jgi:starch synthase